MDHGEEQGVLKSGFSESLWRDLTDDDVRALARSPDLPTLKELNRIGVDQWRWSDDPAFFHNFVAMVIHCGSAGGIRSPVGTLKSLMKKRDWQKITGTADDQATAFLRQHKPPPAPIVMTGFGAIAGAEESANRNDQLRRLAEMQR